MVVVIGGTSVVLASHRSASGGHSAAPRQQSGATADQDGPSAPTATSSAATSSVAGRSFTISGVEHTVFKPFNGHPGSAHDTRVTYKVTCDATTCSVSIPDSPIRRLAAAGPNSYRATYVEHSNAKDTAILHWPVTETLTIDGTRATVVRKNQGAIKREPNVTTTHHPGTRTLTGPIHFTD